MAKQEEIREGLKGVVVRHQFESVEMMSDTILGYLHSQGVVIKVDRELPKNCYNSPENYEHEDGFYSTHEMYDVAQQDMLKAGYGAFKPLIKEG